MKMIDLEVVQKDAMMCVTRYINALAYVDPNLVYAIFVANGYSNKKQQEDKTKIHILRQKMYQMFLKFLSEDNSNVAYDLRILALTSVLSHVETALKNTSENKSKTNHASLDGIWKTPQVLIDEAYAFIELFK